jgi:23S rRNA pseudouridine1911/1915/1917 synthase
VSIRVLNAKPRLISISAQDVDAKGPRADQILAKEADFPSRSQLKDWFESGCIMRNGEPLKTSSKLYAGDKITVYPKAPKQIELEPRPMALNIMFEDDDLIVLYKPEGISMHPGASKSDETTLVHGLLAHSKDLSDKGGEFRPGIVHRLDKETEGVIVVAKNNKSHEALSKQFETRTIDRRYWALAWGKVPAQIEIEGNIGRHPKNRKKMAITLKGREAKTIVKRLKYFEEGYSLVECKLMTGRTHQIRVHLAHKKHGLLGDRTYSRKRSVKWSAEKEKAYESLNGQALVAYRLEFNHPKTKQKVNYQVDYPSWMLPFLKD